MSTWFMDASSLLCRVWSNQLNLIPKINAISSCRLYTILNMITYHLWKWLQQNICNISGPIKIQLHYFLMQNTVTIYYSLVSTFFKKSVFLVVWLKVKVSAFLLFCDIYGKEFWARKGQFWGIFFVSCFRLDYYWRSRSNHAKKLFDVTFIHSDWHLRVFVISVSFYSLFCWEIHFGNLRVKQFSYS